MLVPNHRIPKIIQRGGEQAQPLGVTWVVALLGNHLLELTQIIGDDAVDILKQHLRHGIRIIDRPGPNALMLGMHRFDQL